MIMNTHQHLLDVSRFMDITLHSRPAIMAQYRGQAVICTMDGEREAVEWEEVERILAEHAGAF